MDLLTRDSDLIPCPHCGHQVRKGMIRCRECNGVIDEDFVLAPNVAPALRRCQRCGTEMEQGITDCPACASAMLDQLLSAPPPEPAERPAARSHTNPGGSRPWGRTSQVAGEAESPPHSGRKVRRPNAPPQRDEADNETGTDVLFESETSVDDEGSIPTSPELSRRAAASVPTEETAGSEACRALIAALTTSDPDALCGVVTALGKLGDKRALKPLERLMTNPEVRVRRAVAAALIRLGHPKADSLLETVEQPVGKPTEAPPAPASRPKARPNRAPVNWGALTVPGLALAGLLLVGGGVWWWATSPPRPSSTSSTASSVKTAPVPSVPNAQPVPATKPTAQQPKAPTAPPVTTAQRPTPPARTPPARTSTKRAPLRNDYDP